MESFCTVPKKTSPRPAPVPFCFFLAARCEHTSDCAVSQVSNCSALFKEKKMRTFRMAANVEKPPGGPSIFLFSLLRSPTFDSSFELYADIRIW